MAPKFRGGSDDWLDDEDLIQKRNAGVRPKKAISARAIDLPFDQANAVVAEVFPNQCKVRLDESGTDLLCSYRRAGVVGKSKTEARERTPVAVGDRVLVTETGDGTGVIEGIVARKNCISRPAPGRDATKFQHVLAANIDLLVIVASCREPEFSSGLIDRFLVAAESEDVPSCLCITKTDLVQKSDQNVWEIYKDIQYPVFELSLKKGLGLSALKEKIMDQTVVFCGHSGVGKTSLLTALLGTDAGKVGLVSEFTGKGRHTTTGAVLLGGPGKSNWIDTPGVREFGLTQVSPEELGDCFPEFANLSCAQKTCLHQDEEQCLARSLPRYESYRRILNSLLAGEN